MEDGNAGGLFTNGDMNAEKVAQGHDVNSSTADSTSAGHRNVDRLSTMADVVEAARAASADAAHARLTDGDNGEAQRVHEDGALGAHVGVPSASALASFPTDEGLAATPTTAMMDRAIDRAGGPTNLGAPLVDNTSVPTRSAELSSGEGTAPSAALTASRSTVASRPTSPAATAVAPAAAEAQQQGGSLFSKDEGKASKGEANREAGKTASKQLAEAAMREARLTRSLEATQRELAEVQEKMNARGDADSDAAKKIADLKAKVAQMSRKESRAEAEAAEARAAAEEAKAAAVADREAAEEAKRRVGEARAKLAAAEARDVESRAQCEMLSSQLEKLRQQGAKDRDSAAEVRKRSCGVGTASPLFRVCAYVSTPHPCACSYPLRPTGVSTGSPRMWVHCP